MAFSDYRRGVSPTVEMRGISQTYTTGDGEKVLALKETTLTVDPGEFVCIVGPSGCGKSTMMNMLAGFMPPSTGDILLDGAEVTGPGKERGVVFQRANLYPWMTVRENVELYGKFQKISKKEREETAEHYLKMVGLQDFMDRRPYELSGGMQQRCQIARVLAADPEVILMDEPFGALDPFTREMIQLELLQIWREKKRTVFFITHSVDEAVFLATRVLVMSARPGRVIEDIKIDVREGGTIPDDKVRATDAFHHLRDEIAAAIYAAQGGASDKALFTE
ncbi:MAG: ABC transporter ATP-binding protein [Corynebacterium sp.]|nr:ABC transporter ATP-binding protein [Corynebacterium sp.]